MTGYDRYHPLVKQALAAKPDKLLYKPIDPEKLRDIVNYYEAIFKCTNAPALDE